MSGTILVENKDDRRYTARYKQPVKGSAKAISKSVNFEANEITSIDLDLWEALIATNGGVNVINNKLQQGRLNIIGSHGQKSEEIRHNVDSREIEYQKFVNVYKQIQAAGGTNNKELAPFIKNGMPTFEMARHNLGELNKEQYEGFVNRISKECQAGMHQKSLTVPGEQKASQTPEFDKDTISENPETDTYSEHLAVLEKAMPEILEKDGLSKDKKSFKRGVLEGYGIKISKDEKKHLMSLYLEKHPMED